MSVDVSGMQLKSGNVMREKEKKRECYTGMHHMHAA